MVGRLFPDSKTIALSLLTSGGEDVTLWDVASGRPKRAPRLEQPGFTTLAFSPDGKTLATAPQHHVIGGPPEELQLWDLDTGQLLASARDAVGEGGFKELKFSPDGAQLLVGQSGGFFQITYSLWETATLRRLGRNRAGNPAGMVRGDEPAFSSDGRLLAVAEDVEGGQPSLLTGEPVTSGKWGRAVRLLDPASLQERGRLEAGWWTWIGPPVFSPDGRFVTAGGYCSSSPDTPHRGFRVEEVKVWDANTGREEATLRGYGEPRFAPTGDSLAAVGGGSVTVWDVPVPSRTWRLLGAVTIWVLIPLLVGRALRRFRS